jgi:hypothetical protein
MNERWHPWGALRERGHIKIQKTWLRGTRGLWVPNDDGTSVIHLDPRMGRRERRCVLAHELVHEERGIAYDWRTPNELVQTEERMVAREAARRLVPPAELVALIRAMDGEPLELWEISDHFDVDQRTARLACALIG